MMFELLPEYIGQVWPLFMWGVVIVAAIGCCMGFKEFVWFMSVGYGFSVMCIGAYLLILGLIKGYLTVTTAIMCALFVIYGYRLGGYILKRELTNAAYKKTLESTGSTKAMPVFVSIPMWAYSMWMYTAQTSAVTYRFINQAKDNVWAWVGVAVMALAILGESTADRQKSAAKKKIGRASCRERV